MFHEHHDIYAQWNSYCLELQTLIGHKDAKTIINMIKAEANTYSIDVACVRIACALYLAHAGVISKNLIGLLADHLEFAACEL